MLIHDVLNKDPYIVLEEYPLIILDIKYDVCMAKNDKDIKHTRHDNANLRSTLLLT